MWRGGQSPMQLLSIKLHFVASTLLQSAHKCCQSFTIPLPETHLIPHQSTQKVNTGDMRRGSILLAVTKNFFFFPVFLSFKPLIYSFLVRSRRTINDTPPLPPKKGGKKLLFVSQRTINASPRFEANRSPPACGIHNPCLYLLHLL